MNDTEQPRFRNSCNDWTFLGQFDEFDLYTDGGIAPGGLMIAKFGDEARACNAVGSWYLARVLAGTEELKKPELRVWDALKEAFLRARH
jgi:hypothetical protein